MEQILTSVQRQAIALVAEEPQLKDFYLTGGTALAAYYLGHRYSDDLDFFTFDAPDLIFLHGFVEKMKNTLKARSVRYQRLYDRNQFFFECVGEGLKIEFTRYPFAQLEKPVQKDGISIDSLRDITANKLMAMLDRFDPKDFVDLYFLLQDRDITNVTQDTQTKFGVKIDNVFLGGELMKVMRIAALPKMIKLLTIDDLKAFFTAQAKTLGPEILTG